MVWKTILAALVFVGLCVLGLGFNVIFRKNGKFPETEISRNPEMRKRGIRCVQEEESALPGGAPSNKRFSSLCEDCAGCELYFEYKRNNHEKQEEK